MKLTSGQKHMLSLIEKEKKADGWAAVSKMVMPLLRQIMPRELVELEQNSDGAGRARLTRKGVEVFGAMAWL